MNPRDLKYSEEHEWLRVECGGSAVIGITEFATESLGDSYITNLLFSVSRENFLFFFPPDWNHFFKLIL